MSDEVSIEDLLKQGGRREEAPGVVATAWRQFRSGINPFWDEGAGVVDATLETAGRLARGEFTSPREWASDYRHGRDESRRNDDIAAAANPRTAGVSRFAGALTQGLATAPVGGTGLLGAVRGGAALGGIQSIGDARAEDPRDAMGDIAKGILLGAGAGGVGYGVGRGLQRLGGFARDALGRARGQLQDEAVERIAREEAALAEGAAAREAQLAKEQGSALELNKRVDARMAQQQARAQRASQPRPARSIPSADEFRFTDGQLVGLQRQARGAVAERLNKGRGFRADLANPEVTTRRRRFAQEYLDANDVSDPAAAVAREVRQNMAMKLGRMGYGPDDVERILARYAKPETPSPLPERTQTMDFGDAVKQGRGPELARSGGGGSAFDGWPDDARTVWEPPEAVADDLLPPMEEITQQGYPPHLDPRSFEPTNPGVARSGALPSAAENYARGYGLPLPERVQAPVAPGAGAEPIRQSPLVPPPRVRPGVRYENLDGVAPGRFDAPTADGVDVELAMRRAAAAEARVAAGAPAAGPGTVNIRRPTPPDLQRPAAAAPPPPAQLQQDPLPDVLTRPGLPAAMRDPSARAAAAEADAMGGIYDAALRGAQQHNNALSGAMGAMRGVTREAFQNPAVRARALETLKLHRLAQLDPSTFSRVSMTLQRAAVRGPEHLKATRHTLLQTDPAFREADQRAEKELEGLDDAALEARLRATGGP